MAAQVLLVIATVVGLCRGALLSDEQYYKMPRLFHLDDYKSCLSQDNGIYCLGSFQLSPIAGGEELFSMMQDYSTDKSSFNHTLVHRGYCVSTRCVDSASSSADRFTQCVDSQMRAQHKLQASLLALDYCRSGGDKWQGPDTLDLTVAAIVAALVVINVSATFYHYWCGADSKPNRYIEAWSLRTSWARLTATYDDGDGRLTALNSVQGVKTITLLLIIMAHTCFSHYTGYIYNPLFLEKAGRIPMSYYFFNGTVIVQTFVMLSSFLLAYNLLLNVDNNPKRRLSLLMLPKCITHRLARIVPLYLFVIGLASTWWAHVNDGALWKPLVEAEVLRCRRKWWAQILFVNNFVEPDERCLIQTWFLAVDMQLYILGAILTLVLGRWPRTALKITGLLFVGSVVGIFLLSNIYGLKSVLFLMKTEVIRTLLTNNPSFTWLYTAPWGSLPASFLGLFLAFLHFDLEKRGIQIREYMIIRIAYRVSVPLMFAWVLAGYWFQQLSSPLAISMFTAIDRPVFVLLVAIVLLGFFNKIDSLWWRFLSWRGFVILGRMSLPILLFHWSYNLSIIGGRLLPSQASILEIGGDWLTTIFLTYVSALPATLFVELPMQKFLQTLLG